MKSSKSNFEVRNTNIEKILRDIANVIKKALPTNWGFTLLIFDYSKPDQKDAGSMFYISTADRETMKKAMLEFIERKNIKN